MTGLLLNLVFVALLVAALAFSSRLLGPKVRIEGEGGLPYETGMPPLDSALARMSVPYIRFALLFVLFDVDLAFLLPWALTRPQATLGGLLTVTGFVGIVALMLAYLWRKGMLECD